MTMDRKIEKKKLAPWQWGLIAVLAAVAIWFIYQLLADASIRTYRVPQEHIIVSTVEFGAFEDLIPIRGTIQPFNSVFLDAVIGGAVDEVFVEEGSFVTAGQALVQLSNTTTRLTAATADANTTEQLNNLSNISNNFETTKLNTEREIINIEYRITTLERLISRAEKLVANSLVSEEEFEALADELVYQEKVLTNTLARQVVEVRIRAERLLQIEVQMVMLEENLKISQSSFESLLVRAPISGQLQFHPGGSSLCHLSGEGISGDHTGNIRGRSRV